MFWGCQQKKHWSMFLESFVLNYLYNFSKWWWYDDIEKMHTSSEFESSYVVLFEKYPTHMLDSLEIAMKHTTKLIPF